MSSSLFWRPPAPDGETLGDDLKFILRTYWSVETMGGWCDLNRSDVPFLHGVIAGAGKNTDLGRDAQTLIDKIAGYGSVQVREQP